MTGDSAVRQAEDIGGQELSYAEVKAIASGNPAVLTLAEADAELQRLAIMKRNHDDEQYLARRARKDFPGTIKRLEDRLAALTADQATMKAQDGLTIGGRETGDPLAALGEALDRLPQHVMQDRRVPLGTYRGLRFGMVLHPQWRPQVFLEGEITRQDSLGENRGPRAVLNAVERLAKGYHGESERTRQDVELAETQLRDYQARVGQPFSHDAYLTELARLRDQLKAGLSGAATEGATQGQSTVSDLAEQIKALKTAHTIEAMPERTGKRRTSAEEPVTDRIRRQVQANPACAPAADATPAVSEAEMPLPNATENPSNAAATTLEASCGPLHPSPHPVTASITTCGSAIAR